MVAERGAKSLIGRDWLNAFNYTFVSPDQNEGKRNICIVTSGTTKPIITAKPSETVHSKIWKDHQKEQLKLKQQFKELFERQRKVNKHKVQIEFKQNAKSTQLKGRQVPIQLQEAAQAETDKFLEDILKR